MIRKILTLATVAALAGFALPATAQFGADVRSTLERATQTGPKVPLFSVILVEEEGQPQFLVRQQIPGKEMTMVLSLKIAGEGKIPLKKAKFDEEQLARFRKENESRLDGKWRRGIYANSLNAPFTLKAQARIAHPSKETDTMEVPMTVNWVPTGDKFLRLDCHREGGSIYCKG